jgi:two-component system CheB/CheR fusion protein
MKLRSHILFIGVVMLVPILVIMCVEGVFLFRRMRDDQLQTFIGTARALSSSLDKSFEKAIASLSALSASRHLQTGDLKTLYEDAKRALAAQRGAEAIVLVNPQGGQIMNTRLAFGAPLPRGGGTLAQRVAQSGSPAVSNLLAPVAQKPVVAVGVPVLVAGDVKYVLTMELSSAFLQRLLDQQDIPPDSLCTVIDGNKTIAARSSDSDKYLGMPADASLAKNSSLALEGSWIGEPVQFEPVYAAHHRSTFSGWTVALGIPISKLHRPLWIFMAYAVGGVVIFIVIAFLLATFFGRRIVASVTALAEGAKALGTGVMPEISPLPVAELDQVRKELEAAASKRSAMENAVRRSEERLRTIIETEPECVTLLAADGTLLEMNAAGLQMIGAASIDTVQGKNILEFVVPECRGRFTQLTEKVFEGQTGKLEFELVGLRGKRRWMETHAAPLRGAQGEVYALIAVSRDITERKRAEDALRASEERLKLALASSQMGAWECDFASASMFWSPECHQLLGQELPNGTFESFTKLIYPEDAGAVEALAHQAIDKKTLFSAEFRIRTQDEVRWFSSHGRAEYDENGKPLRMIGTIQDITERKRLLVEVQERAAQLAEADRRKDEFLAVLAHELRNPLAPVTNAVEILRLNGLSNPQSLRAAEMVDDQMEHMTRLIDDLVDVSRLTRGTFALRKEVVDLSQVVKSAVDQNRQMVEDGGLHLVVELPTKPLKLEADRVRLIQVLSNLLNNAGKYTEPGGSIFLRAEQRDNEIIISVKDTGIGIPPDKLEHVFELFAQLDASGQGTRTGLGLGLTLVRRLVESHGGSVEAESEGLEKGSEFIIRLPALAQHVGEELKQGYPAPTAKVALEEMRVLVVDDNRAAADMLATLFRLKGNPVELAFDGEEALAAAEKFLPDVVLLDLGMPKLNGYDACRRMRQQAWGQKMIIIALTGWGRDEDRERTREAGFDYHLVKPVRPLNLLEVIGDLAKAKLS